MRKLTQGNKKIMVLFSIIVIVIVAILVMILRLALNIAKEEYTIEGSKFLYDEEYNPLKINDQSTIKKNWNGKYYLKTLSDEQTYNLGEQAIVFDLSKIKLDIYGTIYKIYNNGQVSKLTSHNELASLAEDGIYKLADRKYLLTGEYIADDKQVVNTRNYLIVVIDKAGNTMLLNNEVNIKTINPMIISTSTFSFDIANEKLIYNDEEIDLKKIIGSTNEYKEEINEDEKELADESSQGESNVNGENGANGANGQNGANGSTSIFGTELDLNFKEGIAQTLGSFITNAANNSGNGETQTPISISKSAKITGVSAGSTYIDVGYLIIDPQKRYQTVYITIEGDITKTIALDKSSTKYRVTGLTPNTNYTIQLNYKELTESNTLNEQTEDTIKTKTAKSDTSLKVSRVIIHDDNTRTIYFNFKTDPNYAYDSADIQINVDGVTSQTVTVNMDASKTSSGWSTSVKVPYGSETRLKIVNAVYNGQQVSSDISATIKN